MSNPVKTIQSLLEEGRDQFIFSAYQLYAEHRGAGISLHGGVTSYWPNAAMVTETTRFDVGSVTKAIATGSLFALGADRKELRFEDPVSRWIPELKPTPLGALTLAHLLSHSAGLRWWYPLYREPQGLDLVDWFARNAVEICEVPAGTRSVYSDLGYLLLGLVAERQWGKLPEIFESRIATPLGLKSVGYGPVGGDVAATEFCLYRRRLLQGEVFDENAASLGGKCGHAGLFATALGLGPWCAEWLKAVRGKSSWLGEETAKKVSARAGVVGEATWGFGWDTKSESGSSAGKLFSSRSFGHLGYPGCSVWLDPVAEGFVVLLTNRIHPSRLDERIRQFRPKLHDAVAELWAVK